MCQLCNLVNLANRQPQNHRLPRTLSTWSSLATAMPPPLGAKTPSLSTHSPQLSPPRETDQS